jgi:opacity protein-like surface antigen
MRKFLLGTAALMALASPAISADMRLPVTKAPPPVVPVWNWSGCYVGGHAGGLWANSGEWIVRTPGGDFFGQSLGEHGLNGWVGGAQAGCDYQFAGGFVIGVQGDYAVADAEGSHDSAREIGVAYHSRSSRWHRSPVASAMAGIASSVTSRGAAPGSATIIGRPRSYSGRPIRRARRARDGPLGSAVNMPSPTFCPASSNTAITILARATLASRRK